MNVAKAPAQATVAGRQQPVFVRTAPSNAAIASRWPPGQGLSAQSQQRTGVSGSPPSAQARSAGTAPAACAGAGQLHRQQAATALPNVQHGVQGRGTGEPAEDDLLDPDQDPNSLRSPGGSLVSSVTTLPCPLGAGEGSAGWSLSGGPQSARGHGGSSGTAGFSIPEVLATVESLASRVNECLEQMPTRIDEATSEFRAEFTSLRAEVRAVSEASASCLVRTEVLEKSLKEESSNLSAAIKSSSSALKQELSEQLNEGLDGAREQRQELAEELRNLGRDLREQFQQELERLRDSVMREMRERMDGQKVLREEVQLQQGSLLRLTSRVEESLVELRTELPRLSQDQISQQQEIQRIQEAIGSAQGGGLQAKTEQLDRFVREQRDQHLAVEADLRQELKEMQQQEAARNEQQISSLKERLGGEQKVLQEALEDIKNELRVGMEEQTRSLQKRRTELVQALDEKAEMMRRESSDSASQLKEEIRGAEQAVRDLVQDAGNRHTEGLAGLQRKLEGVCDEQWRSELEARESLQLRVQAEAQEAKEQIQLQLSGLERALVELDDGLRRADKRVGECETAFQQYVEETVSGRISAVDKSLKKEMAERASTHDQVLDMITHNSERWCHLQAKFDELLVQVQKNNLSSFVSAAGGSIGSHGASTPVGSNFGGNSVVDVSNGGPLAGRSSEDR